MATVAISGLVVNSYWPSCIQSLIQLVLRSFRLAFKQTSGTYMATVAISGLVVNSYWPEYSPYSPPSIQVVLTWNHNLYWDLSGYIIDFGIHPMHFKQNQCSVYGNSCHIWTCVALVLTKLYWPVFNPYSLAFKLVIDLHSIRIDRHVWQLLPYLDPVAGYVDLYSTRVDLNSIHWHSSCIDLWTVHSFPIQLTCIQLVLTRIRSLLTVVCATCIQLVFNLCYSISISHCEDRYIYIIYRSSQSFCQDRLFWGQKGQIDRFSIHGHRISKEPHPVRSAQLTGMPPS